MVCDVTQHANESAGHVGLLAARSRPSCSDAPTGTRCFVLAHEPSRSLWHRSHPGRFPVRPTQGRFLGVSAGSPVSLVVGRCLPHRAGGTGRCRLKREARRPRLCTDSSPYRGGLWCSRLVTGGHPCGRPFVQTMSRPHEGPAPRGVVTVRCGGESGRRTGVRRRPGSLTSQGTRIPRPTREPESRSSIACWASSRE